MNKHQNTVTGGSSSTASSQPVDPMDSSGGRNWWLILAGPAVAIVLTFLLPDSLAFEGRAVAGIAIWMALW